MLKQENILIKSRLIKVIAPALNFEETTFVEPLALVLNSQERSRVSAGDRVLIIGAGTISIMYTQVARHKKVS